MDCCCPYHYYFFSIFRITLKAAQNSNLKSMSGLYTLPLKPAIYCFSTNIKAISSLLFREKTREDFFSKTQKRKVVFANFPETKNNCIARQPLYFIRIKRESYKALIPTYFLNMYSAEMFELLSYRI